MGQTASGSNFSVAATEKLPVPQQKSCQCRNRKVASAATEKLPVGALSYKAVFSIRATKQLSN